MDHTERMERKARIASLIKKLREESGMSRKEFAKVYGMPVRTLEEWEVGRRNPPEYVVRMLAYIVRLQATGAVEPYNLVILEDVDEDADADDDEED